MAKGKGRRAGARNRGNFNREGRGWFTKGESGKFVPLDYGVESGLIPANPIKG